MTHNAPFPVPWGAEIVGNWDGWSVRAMRFRPPFAASNISIKERHPVQRDFSFIFFWASKRKWTYRQCFVSSYPLDGLRRSFARGAAENPP